MVARAVAQPGGQLAKVGKSRRVRVDGRPGAIGSPGRAWAGDAVLRFESFGGCELDFAVAQRLFASASSVELVVVERSGRWHNCSMASRDANISTKVETAEVPFPLARIDGSICVDDFLPYTNLSIERALRLIPLEDDPESHRNLYAWVYERNRE